MRKTGITKLELLRINREFDSAPKPIRINNFMVSAEASELFKLAKELTGIDKWNRLFLFLASFYLSNRKKKI